MTESNLTPAHKNANFIALFPAAGHARRLAASVNPTQSLKSGSKEILPVPDIEGDGTIAVGDYLVREYRRAGIRDIIIIRREEKQDIADHYRKMEAQSDDVTFKQVITAPTPSTAHSIDKAWELFRHRPVALGFPDIIIRSPGIFNTLCDALISHKSDICLALFPATNPEQTDMVSYRDLQVERIEIKPTQTDLKMTWSCAVWQPRFSEYLHQQVAHYDSSDELYIGKLFQAAILSGMNVTAVTFPQGFSLDIGTPETLNRALSLKN